MVEAAIRSCGCKTACTCHGVNLRTCGRTPVVREVVKQKELFWVILTKVSPDSVEVYRRAAPKTVAKVKALEKVGTVCLTCLFSVAWRSGAVSLDWQTGNGGHSFFFFKGHFPCYLLMLYLWQHLKYTSDTQTFHCYKKVGFFLQVRGETLPLLEEFKCLFIETLLGPYSWVVQW